MIIIYGLLKDFFLKIFQEKGEEAIPTFCKCSVPKEVFMFYYQKFPPIEEMSDKDKDELKKYITELFPEQTIEEKVMSAKIVYSIGSLI